MLRRLFLLWTLALAALAAAQFPPGMQLPNVEYNPLLMLNAKVQKELNISPSVASRIQQVFMDDAMKILPAVTGPQAGKRPLSDKQKTAAVMDGINAMQRHITALLTPAQLRRYRQLTLQSIGAAGVLQPKVAKSLGLTAAQRAKLQEGLSEANERIASGIKRGPGSQGQAFMGELSRLQADAKAQGYRVLRATLTPAQKAKWAAMQGKPFPMNGFLGVGNVAVGR